MKKDIIREPAGFAAPGPIKHPRDHVQLQLGAGEYASYTIREKETYTVSVTYCADKEVKVQAAIQGETLFEGVMPPAGEKVTSDVHPYFAYETSTEHTRTVHTRYRYRRRHYENRGSGRMCTVRTDCDSEK